MPCIPSYSTHQTAHLIHPANTSSGRRLQAVTGALPLRWLGLRLIVAPYSSHRNAAWRRIDIRISEPCFKHQKVYFAAGSGQQLRLLSVSRKEEPKMKDSLNNQPSKPEGNTPLSLENLLRRLQRAGLTLTRSDRLPNQTGYQMRFATGEIVNLFDTGRVTIQGKNQDRVNRMLGLNNSLANSNAEQKGGDAVTKN